MAVSTGQGWRYAEFSFNGLEELKRAVKVLPMTMADQAQAIVDDTVKDVAAELKSAYPKGPGRPSTGYKGGNLRKGVKYRTGKRSRGKVVAKAWVMNTASHAWIYDHGTGSRNWMGRDRGSMPATFLFERITIRAQLALQDEWIDLMRAHQLKVTRTG